MREIGQVDDRAAARLLREAGGSAKLAIAMARLGVNARSARRALASARGSLRALLD